MGYDNDWKKEFDPQSGRLVPKRALDCTVDDLFDALLTIVNTAQTCPDRCMVDVCNDNFLAHGVNLRAEMTGAEDTPIKIESTSNEQVEARL